MVDSSGILNFKDVTQPGQSVHTVESSREFQAAHMTSDVDADDLALHHTLGFGAHQGIPARILQNIAPIGQRLDFAGKADKVPRGFLIEDGRSLAVADYPLLFEVIGYTYGGSGANFNIPDSRKRSSVGANGDSEVGTSDGLTLGSRTQTVSVAHNHAVTSNVTVNTGGSHGHSGSASSAPDHVHGSGSLATGTPSSAITRSDGAGTAAHPAHTHSVTGSTDLNGSHGHTITVGSDSGHSHSVNNNSVFSTTDGGSAIVPYIKSTKIIRYSWGQ